MLSPEPYVMRLRDLASHCESRDLSLELERIADVLEEQYKKIESQHRWLVFLGFALFIVFGLAIGLHPKAPWADAL